MIREILESRGIFAYRIGKKDFFTYWTRPKNAEDIVINPDGIKNVAIVIQGPIKYEDNFTLETVKLYKKMFPKCLIILSTWSNESKELLELAAGAGAHICLSDLPVEKKGLDYSINLQRMNTLAGIKYAEEVGITYCIKTRTDQRFFNVNTLEFCAELLDMFPCSDKNIGLNGRIITTSSGTFVNRLYNVSDLFLFGYTKDLLLYFSCEEDDRPHEKLITNQNALEFSKRRTGEIWFATSFIERIGHEILWTKEDSDYIFAEYFIVIDAESIDLYWPKYTRREYRWRNYSMDKLSPLTFAEWLLLYKKMEAKKNG